MKDDDGEWDSNPEVLYFHGQSGKDNEEGFYYGLELETDAYSYENRRRAIRDLRELQTDRTDAPLFWLKGDGSLDNGIEICFHPRTIPAWTSFLMSSLFDEIKKTVEQHGGKSYNTSTCGLHIHREQLGLDNEIKCRLAFFVGHTKAQLQKIAQRQATSYCSFNRYRPWKTLQDVYYTKRNGGLSGRDALTLESYHDTVEFRFYKGTLAPKTITGQLGITDALLDWLSTHQDRELEELADHKMLWGQFIKDLSTLDNPAAPFIHYLLGRKGFYTLATKEATCA